MTDHPTDPTDEQLRKALGAVNDLEPPPDDLFVQRAVSRGRARTARRRSSIVGAAAGVALVGVLGGGWVVGQLQGGGHVTATSGSAQGAPDTVGRATGTPDTSGRATGVPTIHVPAARDTSIWLSGASSPQRTAFDAIAATVAANYPDVFGGAYATDPGNTHLVVTVTRHDAELESFVTHAMPAPGDVDFVVVGHTAAEKVRVAEQIRADTPAWTKQGLTIERVAIDARTDRVVVSVAPVPALGGAADSAADRLAQRYGPDLVVVSRAPSLRWSPPTSPHASIPVTPVS